MVRTASTPTESLKKGDDSSFEVDERVAPGPLKAPKKLLDDAVVKIHEGDNDGESFDNVPASNRRLGTLSAVMLIANRMIGTGVFATPASIVAATNSIGVALLLWCLGALIAGAGLLVYLEWATAIPRSGGEKNYLEFAYKKPVLLATSAFAAYAALLGWPSGNATYTGTMLLNAAQVEPTRWNERLIGVATVSFALLLHSFLPSWGIRLQNALGFFKIGVLLFIIITGFVALGGHVPGGAPNPSNFTDSFAGARIDGNGFVNALYSVIWAFVGYSNAGYALSEIRNPIRTIKIAAPLALALVTILYLLVNIAFFAVVPKAELIESNRLVAALFIEKMFGAAAGRAISVIIALSAIGNVLAVLFGQGRINQELGREGVLPFSKFFASNKPCNAPAAGLGLQYIVTLVIILAPPGGDAYAFLLNLISYPLNVVNTFVAFGLILVNLNRSKSGWKSPFSATLPVTIFFFLANLFLVAAPLVPPTPGTSGPYESLPYWLHVVVGIGLFVVGGLYWVVWVIILPRLGGYQLARREEVGDDGLTRRVVFKVHNE